MMKQRFTKGKRLEFARSVLGTAAVLLLGAVVYASSNSGAWNRHGEPFVCETGLKMQPPLSSGGRPEALASLRRSYHLLLRSGALELPELLARLREDQARYGHDELEEARDAYLLAALDCEVLWAPIEQARVLQKTLVQQGDAYLTRYPKGPYSEGVEDVICFACDFDAPPTQDETP